MKVSSNYQHSSDIDRLQALLAIAENQAKRSRIVITQLEVEAANDHAFLSLASALLFIKDNTGFTWGNLTYNLNQPCSEEMLRKIASRAKTPSYKTFNRIHDALLTLARKHNLELPEIKSMRQFN